MHIAFRKRVPGEVEFGIIYGGIAMLLLAAAWLPPVVHLAPDCMFKRLTGIPCPTCGSTRAVLYLSHGDIATAFFMNPITALLVITAVVYFFYSLVTLVFGLPRIILTLSDKEKNIVRIGVVLLLLVQWSYLFSSR